VSLVTREVTLRLAGDVVQWCGGWEPVLLLRAWRAVPANRPAGALVLACTAAKEIPASAPSIASRLRSRFESCDLTIKPRKILPPLRIAWCEGDQPRHYFASFAELDRRFGDFATF